MKKITDIKPQAKTPTRCNIYLDNSFYCGLELETVMKFRLKVGQEIEPERLDEIQLDSEKIKALDKALTFISKSKKTKKQVKDYLYKKGYTIQTVDAVILKMEDYRFIADDDYAEGYVKTYSKSKGKRLLKMELKQKGVSEEDMASALSLVEDESENALAVAQKYMKNKEKDAKNTLKCYKYLLSKGFGYDVAKEASQKAGKSEDDIS